MSRSRQEGDEDAPRTTKRQRAVAAKKTASGPIKTMKELTLRQFLEIRNVNPYVIEKNTRLCPNPYFYTKNQERIFNEIYKVKNFACCPQWSTNVEKMDANLEYFGEAKAICEEFGIVPLMNFNHPFNDEIICQFYSTVNFEQDENEVRSLTWMTKEFVMRASWEEFAHGLGYTAPPPNTPNVFRVHLRHKPMAKDKMIDLYIPGRACCGSAYDLLPTYDIFNRIFRNTLNPKKGNLDEVHGFLVDLLVLTHRNKGRGMQLDSMDYIWHEMRDCSLVRKLPAFAPYIMRLICLKWDAEGRGDLLTQCDRLTPHPVRGPLIKQHAMPRVPVEEEEQEEEDPDYELPLSKTKGWFAKLTARLKKSFCLKLDLQDKMYYEHEQNKKIRQRQKAMMTHMGLEVSDGSENVITPREEWISKHKWSSSEDSIPEAHEPWSRSPPTRTQGDDEDEDEDDDEEEEGEDEDEDEEEDEE